ncbi:membrane protein [Arthrobacter phage Chipper1996]|uniref:Membrane protein n=5 Tax=Klausavirus princesstrina TaxID=1984784 RepID=A0A286N476_9CAUD|nr:hypothetical protein FDI82_gp063 [Arthrobacter phage PrincessTrina]ANU79665.1 membrane protein [Arthrobacter phage Conboy]APC44746.1 membrane protein [Arthrobacter phage EdgarPoe]ASX99183.1 membrane protein [Arthrobacter phage Tophat]QBP30434.1 membrane protein [Arthrobacter phage Chipper1996]ALY09908.1 membrane protein [Arthrobacter phage PrincessTrina]
MSAPQLLNLASALALCVATWLAFFAAWNSNQPRPAWGSKPAGVALLVACVLGLAALLTGLFV